MDELPVVFDMQVAPLHHQHESDVPKSFDIAVDPSTWSAMESKLPPSAEFNIESPVANDALQHDESSLPVSWDDIQNSDTVKDESINMDESEDLLEVCSIGVQEFPVKINKDLTLQLVQASTAFRGVEHDETGSVVWGASVCLARFLTPEMVMGRTVVELGCGCGVPSLVSVKYGASRVIATDMEDKTLQQLDEVAKRNDCQDTLELCKLNWNDSNDENTDNRYDPLHDVQADIHVVLASDVIYHDEMVNPFVQTIDRYLSSENGKAYIALRNTRQGVTRFWREAMPEAGFVLVQSVSCQEYQGGRFEDSDSSELPPGFQNQAHSHRWRGDHTIYVFQKRQTQQGAAS